MQDKFKICKTLSERMEWLRYAATVCTHLQIKVAIFLANSCNSKTGVCNPRQAVIGKAYGMARSNVGKVITELRRAKLIHCQNPGEKVKNWSLILPLEIASPEMPKDDETTYPQGPVEPVCASPGMHKIASPGMHKIARHSIQLSFNQESINPETQSPTLHGARVRQASGDRSKLERPTKAGWRPDEAGRSYFFDFSGLTKEEDFDREVVRFISYNRIKKTRLRDYDACWILWCDRSGKVLGAKTVLHRDDDIPTEQLPPVIHPPPECWRGSIPDFDPLADPESFIENGCSEIGLCTCSAEKRNAIIKELSP